VLAPEERDGGKFLAVAEHVERRGLPLALGNHQCSTRMISPLCGSGQRAMSPAAKIPGALVSR